MDQQDDLPSAYKGYTPLALYDSGFAEKSTLNAIAIARGILYNTVIEPLMEIRLAGSKRIFSFT
jgi:hypothetical protein